MAIYAIKRETVDAIIADLLKKYPEGADSNLTKDDYHNDWCWRQSTDRYTNMTKCKDDPNFGWHVETLARASFFIDKNFSGLRYYLREIDNTASSKAISRRENRLLDRLLPARRSWTNSSTGEAIYSIRLAHGAIVHVISSSDKSAEIMGKTVAAGAGILSSDSRYYAQKVAPADPDMLTQLRMEQVANITKTIQRNRVKVKEIRESSAALTELCVSLQDFNDHMESM